MGVERHGRKKKFEEERKSESSDRLDSVMY